MRNRLDSRVAIVNIAVVLHEWMLTGPNHTSRIERELRLHRGNAHHNDMRFCPIAIKLLRANGYSE